MRLHINGGARDVPDGTSLPALLELLGLRPGSVVAELNGRALTPSEARESALAEGDVLELVRAVAGG